MFENIIKFFKNIGKKESTKESSDTAKERLHLVLMQDRANVSADFLELMKQEIIEVIKKYIDVDEKAIDVRLTNKANEDGTTGAPALYANIPITTIKNEARKVNATPQKAEEPKKEESIKKVEKVKAKKEEEKVQEVDDQEEVIVQEEKMEKKEDKPETKKVISKAKTANKTQKAKQTKTKEKKEEGEKVKEVAKKK